MRKFKLIKEYPGSPKLGYVSEEKFAQKENYIIYWMSQFIDVKPYLGIFWKEIIEKKYQILSLKFEDTIYTLSDELIPINCRTDENVYKYKAEGSCENWINGYEYLHNTEKTIHSVKRLSDGEIFTVGNKVTGYAKKGGGEIISFDIEDDWCGGIAVQFNTNDNRTSIQYVDNIKKSLFTTEDGVEIFEGDDLFLLGCTNWIITDISPIRSLCHPFKGVTGKEFKYFSTEKKAEEYILINKPCLSIKDVKRVFTTALLPNRSRITGWGVNTEKMLDLVREKLEDGDK